MTKTSAPARPAAKYTTPTIPAQPPAITDEYLMQANLHSIDDDCILTRGWLRALQQALAAPRYQDLVASGIDDEHVAARKYWKVLACSFQKRRALCALIARHSDADADQ